MKPVVHLCVLLLGLLLLAGCNPVRPLSGETSGATAGDPTATETQGDVSDAAAGMAALLARQLGVDSSEVTVVGSEAVEWPDSCLGAAMEDEVCAEVITPGHRITLSARGETYTYHTDQNGSWYRLIEGPEVQVGERVAEWRGTADNGACLQATFGTDGIAFGACGGVQTAGRYVSEARRAVLQEMASIYAPFQADTEAGMLDFAGTGDTRANSEEQAALARWGQTAAMEATAGQSFAGLRYDGPAELGTDDTSLCAVLQISGGETQVWACDGTVVTAPLDDSLAATWTELGDRFGAFVYETPSERLTFEGMGRLTDPVWQRALLAWARVTRAELATGQTSATARTALSWHLGPVPDAPDICAHLTVLDYGYAYAEQRACQSGELVETSADWLDQAEMQQFDRWLYTFAPLYVDDNYLNGAGQELMPEEEAGDLQSWAESLWVRVAALPLAPAGSAPASGAEVTCDDPAARSRAYSSVEYGFCLLMPEGYAVVETVPGNFSLVADGDIMDHTSPRVGIEVSSAGDRSLAGIADQMLQDYAPAGAGVTPEAIMVDGAEAIVLDNLPGQDLNRRVVVVHDGFVYSIMFMPLSPEGEPLYQAILESLRFLD
jgi:hypothetical protein